MKISDNIDKFIKTWLKWFFLLLFLTITEYATSEIFIPVLRSAKDILGMALFFGLMLSIAALFAILSLNWSQLAAILNAIFGESDSVKDK